MEVYDTLTEAVVATAKGDTRRIYLVKISEMQDNNRYVLAVSPAAACLAVIGEDNVSLVSRNDRYDAMQQALDEATDAHNENVSKKLKDSA